MYAAPRQEHRLAEGTRDNPAVLGALACQVALGSYQQFALVYLPICVIWPLLKRWYLVFECFVVLGLPWPPSPGCIVRRLPYREVYSLHVVEDGGDGIGYLLEGFRAL